MQDASEMSIIMHTKHPDSIMALGVVSSEGDVKRLYFLDDFVRINADGYIHNLNMLVQMFWMNDVAVG